MSYLIPTVADFKAYFVRDFVYGVDPTTVQDIDIQNAITEAGMMVNEDLFASQVFFSSGYLLMTAHMMCLALSSSTQGVSGRYSWLTSSKSVGSVSESYAIPQRILDNAEFAMLSKTNYGAKYLFIIMPQIAGQVFVVGGATLP